MALGVAQAFKQETGSGTSVTTNSAWTISTGSLIVVFLATWDGSNANHAVSDSINGSYTKIGGTGTGGRETCSIWYKANVTGGTPNITANGGASTQAVTAIWHEVTGADTSAPFTSGESAFNAYVSTANPQTGSVTNAAAASIFFAGLVNDAGNNPTTLTVNSTGSTPTGWALKSSTNSQEVDASTYMPVSVPYLIASSGAATKHGWTTANQAGSYGIAAFKAASGTTYTKTGMGESAGTSSGPKQMTYAETGTGESAGEASGSKSNGVTSSKAGSATSALNGSGGKVVTYAETGSGTAVGKGSGAKVYLPHTSLTIDSLAHDHTIADDTVAHDETGTGVSVRSASGPKVVTYVETVSPVTPFAGSGAKAVVYAETGSATSAFTGSGSETTGADYAKTGAATSALTGSGADSSTFAETGSATSAGTGSGADASTFSETGTGESGAQASGSRAMVFTKTGSGVSAFSASGFNTPDTQKTGSATSALSASGADALTASETGMGESAASASGAKGVVYAETGGATSAFTGSGASDYTQASGSTYTKTGSAASALAGSGADATVFAKAGSGAGAAAGSGAKAAIFAETGFGQLIGVGSGAGQIAANIYAKSGGATAQGLGMGGKAMEYGEAGSSVAHATGAGPRTLLLYKTGSGVTILSGSGPRDGTAACNSELTSITDLAAEHIVSLLRDYCMTTVPSTAFAATEIRQGLLQADPVSRRISLFVNPNDPADLTERPQWSDTLAGDQTSNSWSIQTYEIGGGERWLRRFTVDVDVYLIRTQESRPTARQIGLWVFGRAQQAIQQNPALDLTDYFCEHAFLQFVEKVVPVESGGPPNSFIWRGKMWVGVWTEKP